MARLMIQHALAFLRKGQETHFWNQGWEAHNQTADDVYFADATSLLQDGMRLRMRWIQPSLIHTHRHTVVLLCDTV